jgi:hypothetical protein
MVYLVNPEDLIMNALRLSGVNKLFNHLTTSDILGHAEQIAEEWTNDWDVDQGFGSSDRTYMTKELLDTLIWVKGLPYKTQFSPRLEVVKV